MSASPTEQGGRYVVKCDCGFEVSGSADEVVDAMQGHAKSVHNMIATKEQVLERARPA